jgi:hypothetical protein
MVTPVYAAADSEEKEFWSSSRKSTSLAREAEEQNLTLPVEIKKLAEPIRNRPAEQDSTKTSILKALREIADPTFQLAKGLMSVAAYFVQQLLEPLIDFVVNNMFRAMYNPNIAADQPKELAKYIKPVTNMLKDMAIDLLLLLFILSIWKYWTDAAWKGGGNLMAPVGRLIATLALLMAWSTITDFYIHISNDMLAQMMFGTSLEDKALLRTVQSKISDLFAAGLVGGAVFGQFGSWILFAVMSVLFYEALYILVLKSIQTVLIVAQYMFAPIFLVFFATPDTENIAAGFVRSCIEVSLWTFFWMGFVRIMVYTLNANLGFWGNCFLVIGVLQLMMSVPHFIAKAQISPISEFVSGAVVFKTAFAAAQKASPYMPWSAGGGLLGKGFSKLKDYYKRDPGGDSSDPGNPGLPPSPGGPSAQGPGKALNSASTGTNPGVGTGPPSRSTNSSNPSRSAGQQGRRDPKDDVAEANEGPRKLGVSFGSSGKPIFDDRGELAGVTHGENDSPAQQDFRNAKASLARAALRNPAMRAALADALGGLPDTRNQQPYNRALSRLAFDAAGNWLNGHRGGLWGSERAATDVFKNAYGDMTGDRLNDLLSSMQDPDRPDSPFNPNYVQTGRVLDQAGLPHNPATRAFAMSPEGSKLKGQALKAAYNAFEQAQRPSLQKDGHTPGTGDYNQTLAQKIRESTPDRQKSAAAVGFGFHGVPAPDQPQSTEDWDAWVTQSESLARTLGVNENQAFARLRAMMGTSEARGDTRSVPAKLATAAASVVAAQDSHAPPQGLTADAPLAGEIYKVVQSLATNNPTLIPQRVAAAVKAAKLVGFSNQASPDAAELIEQMLTPETGDWKDGEINPATMGLARRARIACGSVNKNVCMRVVAAGLPEAFDDVAFAVALRSEWNNMPPAHAGNGVAAVVNGCFAMVQDHRKATGQPPLSRTDPVVTGLAACLVKGDTTNFSLGSEDFDFVTNNAPTTQDVLGYNELGTQARAHGVHFSVAEVRTARQIAAQRQFGGRLDNAALVLHQAVEACHAFMPSMPVEQIGAAVTHMSANNMPSASYRNAEVIETFANFAASELADPLLMRAAAHCAAFAPTGQYRQLVEIASLPSIASLKPTEMAQHTRAVSDYLEVPSAPGVDKICPDVDALRKNPYFVNTLIAINSAHGADTCKKIDYVEDMYTANFGTNSGVTIKGIKLTTPP